MTECTRDAIAVVGRAARFPGAKNVNQFWSNIDGKVESIREILAEQRRAAGENPALSMRPDYVPFGAFVDGVEHFDAAYFGYSPSEAAITDPQQRALLECAHAALEDAGHEPATFMGEIGVYVGVTASTYLLRNLLPHPDLLSTFGPHQLMIANDKSSAATRLSYKLGLTGPSVAVDTACSTSLVAVHQACQALLSFETDMALAGAASIVVPQGVGYIYDEGGVLSADGRCRSFDAGSTGTVPGSGVGVVALRRLEDAVAAGDEIHAVIRGSAVNNDGSSKVGFTAPSVEGQARVIVSALEAAGVDASTISYIEAHGTGTPLGDPIEIRALTHAFRQYTDEDGFCAVGSVKTNVGHLDAAAGVCGLIKTVEALRHRRVPPSLNFETPNPEIDFDRSPFYVCTDGKDWTSAGPRRAGVSSFGMGGTNAHVVLEEAPRRADPVGTDRPQVLLLSGATEEALAARASELRQHLADHPLELADVAFTLQRGRTHHHHRAGYVASNVNDAIDQLAAAGRSTEATDSRGPLFMFPGQGVQSDGMTAGLYHAERSYRDALDVCAELAGAHLGFRFTDDLFSSPNPQRLASLTQFTVFSVSYSMSVMLASWGVKPSAVIGYSLGEYAAACVAGVFSLEDAIAAIATRSRLMQQTAPGAMVAVPMPAEELEPLLGPCALAGINTPEMATASGAPDDITDLLRRLEQKGIPGRRLNTSLAFHSPAMDQVLEPLIEDYGRLRLSAPALPIISNVSGTWLEAADAQDPSYWARQLRSTVRFSDALKTATAAGWTTVVEVGPGTSLTALATQIDDDITVATLGTRGADSDADHSTALQAAARLWSTGTPVDWAAVEPSGGRRVSLPTYPFARDRHWIDPPGHQEPASALRRPSTEWLYRPTWRATPVGPPGDGAAIGNCLVLHEGDELAASLVAGLASTGVRVLEAVRGERFRSCGADRYELAMCSLEDHLELLSALEGDRPPDTVVVLLQPRSPDGAPDDLAPRRAALDPIAQLARAFGERLVTRDVAVLVVTLNARRVADDEYAEPAGALASAASIVLGQEYPNLRTASLDLDRVELGSDPDGAAVSVRDELLAGLPEAIVSRRGGQRFVQEYRLVPSGDGSHAEPLRSDGVYLLTGAFGGIGRVLATHLALDVGASVVLVDHHGEDADDALVEDRRRFARNLADSNADVFVIHADVTDLPAMRRGVDQAMTRFGRIDGVFHLAGSAGGGVAPLRRPEDADAVLAPKVLGAEVLDDLFGDHDLDFLVLFSSAASVLGGFGQIDYVAANAYLDAFAVGRSDRHRYPVVSIGWSRWRGIGMARAIEAIDAMQWSAGSGEESIDGPEAIDVLRAALTSGESHIVVSPVDLTARLDEAQRLERFAAAELGGSELAVDGTIEISGEALEQALRTIWSEVLGIADIDRHANFFDLGGDSLLLVQVHRKVKSLMRTKVPVVAIFKYPTIAGLAHHLSEPVTSRRADLTNGRPTGDHPLDVAIVGMSGRFPGASDADQLWRNIIAGVESIVRHDPSPTADAAFVPAVAAIDDVERWDASFFGSSPHDARITDPQQRLFAECAYEALERAGWVSDDRGHDSSAGRVGVFAGAATSSYLFHNLLPSVAAGSLAEADALMLAIGNDKDYLATRVSYQLGLTGPSINVNTACSTSLVAVHLACQSLIADECELAVAGGARIDVSTLGGYVYQEGGLQSPDGRCRPFDENASGTVLGSGVGVVALKRLADAQRDGDHVHAVIKGSAINNDGSDKVGFTAPSVEGQRIAIERALAVSKVPPETIGLVEAHGTGTVLGDPIEVAALNEAMGGKADRSTPCAIGSIKSNIGHLDAAAGVAGLIKAAFALEHRQIPPTLHVNAPNPHIDFDSTAFTVATELAPWHADEHPRRAAVSSFGIGGTNVHVILEEPPSERPAKGTPQAVSSHPWHVVPVSARTAAAADAAAARLAAHLAGDPGLQLPDVCSTLQLRRRAWKHRRAVVATSVTQAASLLDEPGGASVVLGLASDRPPTVAMMYPGQGSQSLGMFSGLAQQEPVFAAAVDACADGLAPIVGWDLRSALGWVGAPLVDLSSTEVTQPALFAVEYGLTMLFQSWGIRGAVLLGHSLGELVAATVAEVLTLDDALQLVAARGRLMGSAPPGAMLSVALSEDELAGLLKPTCVVAAVNAPGMCVASGPVAAIEDLRSELERRAVETRRLPTSHAFHSALMDDVLEPFAEALASLKFRPSTRAIASTVTGNVFPVGSELGADHWIRQLRQPVRFTEALSQVAAVEGAVLVETGPGTQLSSFARRIDPDLGRRVISACGGAGIDDGLGVATAVAKLWTIGVDVDWSKGAQGERAKLVQLPTYPFERQRYWVEPPHSAGAKSASAALTSGEPRRRPIESWCSTPVWRSRPLVPTESGPAHWLLLDDGRLGPHVLGLLHDRGESVTVIPRGTRGDTLEAAVAHLGHHERLRILHLWTVTPTASAEEATEAGLNAALSLAAAVDAHLADCQINLCFAVARQHQLPGDPPPLPEQSLVLGPSLVLPIESMRWRAASVDIGDWERAPEDAASRLLRELDAGLPDGVVAVRGSQRLVRCMQRHSLDQLSRRAVSLRQGGVYLLTGGLGAVGLAIAERLATEARIHLVLLGRGVRCNEVSVSERLQMLRSRAASVDVVIADVTDAHELERAIADVVDRLGPISGVVHAAGIASGGLAVLRESDAVAAVLAPKVSGTRNLFATLARTGTDDLDFVVLCSSTSALTGAVGQVDYVAANAYLDATAAARDTSTATGPRVIAVNWHTWRHGGMAVDTQVPDDLEVLRAASLEDGMEPSEACEVLLRLLSSGAPTQVAVSPVPLRGPNSGGPRPASHPNDDVPLPAEHYRRPDLSSRYVPPSTEIEAEICAIWESVLLVEPVGVNDDFLELGGHSLLATQLVALTEIAFGVHLSLRQVFESPTVALTADIVTAELLESELDDPDAILAMLEVDAKPGHFSQDEDAGQ